MYFNCSSKHVSAILYAIRSDNAETHTQKKKRVAFQKSYCALKSFYTESMSAPFYKSHSQEL